MKDPQVRRNVGLLAACQAMLVSSFTSGATVTTAGWERVNLLALPLVAVVAGALLWFALHQRAQRTAAA